MRVPSPYDDNPCYQVYITHPGTIDVFVTPSQKHKLYRNYIARSGVNFVTEELFYANLELAVSVTYIKPRVERLESQIPNWRQAPLVAVYKTCMVITDFNLTHVEIQEGVKPSISAVALGEDKEDLVKSTLLSNYDDALIIKGGSAIKSIMAEVSKQHSILSKQTPNYVYALTTHTLYLMPMYPRSVKNALSAVRDALIGMKDGEEKNKLLDLFGAFMKSAGDYDRIRAEVLANEKAMPTSTQSWDGRYR